MPHELITERNMTEGFGALFVYVNDVTGGVFIRMFLLAIWCIVTFGLYFSQKRAIGNGDLPMAVAVSGFVCAVVTILLQLISGLIDIFSSTVVFIIAGLSIFWFLFSRD